MVDRARRGERGRGVLEHRSESARAPGEDGPADVGTLLALLFRWLGRDRQAWSVVHVPAPEADAQRQVTREIETVREDRKRVRNRIQGVLASQGVRVSLTERLVEQLAMAQTGDGRPLAGAFRTRLDHECAHLEAIEARLAALTAARDEHIATGADRVATVARQLWTLRAVAETRAAVFSAELFGTRTFHNGRELAALLGLVPVPFRSDQAVRDQGISKAGRAKLRRLWLQIAWGWLRWQPDSALTQWVQRRVGAAG